MRAIYDKIEKLKGNLIVVKAPRVKLGELASIKLSCGRETLGQVIRINEEEATLQVFQSARGLSTQDEVSFLAREMLAPFGDALLGRRFSGSGKPLDKGCELAGVKPLASPSFNPAKRQAPREIVRTNIPMIDMFNSLVKSQKIPIFSASGEPYNKLLMRIANQTDADVVVIGGMGLPFKEMEAFQKNGEESGSMDKTVMFMHQATDPIVECLLVPDMAIAVAEGFALQGKDVLLLLTDMTAYADALKEIAITMDQIPSNRGYPGSLYSDLASRYEKAVLIEGGGSITLVTVTTMPGDDVTHPVPDNTGYITEGQFYLRKGAINPFGSLSRLKQLVIGKVTREDHGELANGMIRLFAESKKAKEREAMGFKLSQWDKKLLSYSKRFEEEMMSLEVNLSIEKALDLGWDILSSCFSKEEVGLKSSLVDKYWK